MEIEEPPPAAFVLRAAEPTDAGTLGSFLMRVLHKRARKAKKLQKAALAASGEAQADATYALRLELRRLRSDLALSSLALRLPADTAPRLLTPALRRLGAPRDAAVIQSVLRTSAAAASPAEPEAARLAALLAGLRAAQEAAFAAALPTLRPNGRPARLVARLTRALAEGEEALGRRLARQPAPDGAVRLLSAAAAELFAHPAWSLALAPTAPPRAGARAWEAALGARARACARLHALRKALREFRYALMSVQKLYKAAGGATEAAFSATLRAVAEMQGHLGDCHDAEVACQALGGSPADDFPATSAELRRRREEAAARLRGCAAAALCAGGQRDFYAALTGLGAAGDTSAEIADEITI